MNIKEWLKNGACISLEPDLVAIGFGKRFWTAKELLSRPCFYSPDFFLQDSTPWFYHEFHEVVRKKELLEAILKADPCKQFDDEWQLPSSSCFDEAFEELQTLFAKGTLKKGVPYIAIEAPFEFDCARLGAKLAALLGHLQGHKMHLYGWWEEKRGMIGLTPEILFRNKANRLIKTVACAGTQDSKFPIKKMLEDTKLALEQRCVVEGIAEALSCFGSVFVGEREVRDFGRLRHFVTPILVKLQVPVNFDEIVRRLHPTQAVGAYPKDVGDQWLKTFDQKLPRGRYGAPFGYRDSQNQHSFCVVAIRNLQWSANTQTIFAGCGIIEQSKREEEWQELQLKLSAIKESFQR